MKIDSEVKVYGVYFLVILLFTLIPLIYLVGLISIGIWVKVAIVAIVEFVIVIFFLNYSEQVLNIILSNRFKKKIGFYVVRCKSKEFDEFIGDELVDLYEDSEKIFSKKEDNLLFVSDYSFMLLPIAKVYEGVLKKVLVNIGLTKMADWESNPGLSVSRYFNPVGNEKIFEALEDKARDKTVPHTIYSTYQECRNKVFHYDPYRDDRIKTIEDAEFYKQRIEHAIEKAYETFVKK